MYVFLDVYCMYVVKYLYKILIQKVCMFQLYVCIVLVIMNVCIYMYVWQRCEGLPEGAADVTPGANW